MPRRKRNWHPNAYFHVVMRGNNRQNIFQTKEDVMQLMRSFEFAAEKDHFTMLAFCIMTNHYHLLIRSEYVDLAKVMARINRKYSDYYAKRYSHVGRWRSAVTAVYSRVATRAVRSGCGIRPICCIPASSIGS